MKNFKQPIIGIAFTCLLSVATYAGDKVGNGGDVFDIPQNGDNNYQFFDVLEYGNNFFPPDLPAFKIVDSQLKSLEQKAPLTAALIRKTFASGVIWSFVKPELKSIQPTGNSYLLLSFNRIQAAISDTQHNTVQINEAVWNQISELSQAYLLLHEALWIAEKSLLSYRLMNPSVVWIKDSSVVEIYGDRPHKYFDLGGTGDFVKKFKTAPMNAVNASDIATNSANIRRLTGFLMSPLLHRKDIFNTEDIRGFILANSASVNTMSSFRDYGNHEVPLNGWNIGPWIGKHSQTEALKKSLKCNGPDHHSGGDVQCQFNQSPLAASITVDSLLEH